MWLTPEKRCFISTAPICWEQTEPSPKVSQQLNYSDWKQLGFLPQEICNIIIPVFSNPSSGSPFVWPGTNWDWISQSCWLAPNGTYWICGSYLWAWLPPVGQGDVPWVQPLLLALYFQSSQKSLLIYPTLKLGGQGPYFTGMIIWLQSLFTFWELQMLCYEWML